jgi:hypothetical protein
MDITFGDPLRQSSVVFTPKSGGLGSSKTFGIIDVVWFNNNQG